LPNERRFSSRTSRLLANAVEIAITLSYDETESELQPS
jgi:hypothetical protein